MTTLPELVTAPIEDDDEPPVQEAAPAAPPQAVAPTTTCEGCGKTFASLKALYGHQRRNADGTLRCTASPGAAPAAAARPVREAIAAAKAAPPPPPTQPFGSAAAGAAAAEAAIRAIPDGATTAQVVATLSHGNLGVAELVALVCLRGLPPPLEDEEYRALRAAWADSRIEIPTWAMQALVTLAILGPRAMAHPYLGPQLREFFTGKPTPKVASHPQPQPAPQPEPAPQRQPQPEPVPQPQRQPQTVRVDLAGGGHVDLPKGAAPAWGAV